MVGCFYYRDIGTRNTTYHTSSKSSPVGEINCKLVLRSKEEASLTIQDSQAQALFGLKQPNRESKLTLKTRNGTLTYFVLL
jgi:hypothetical protein